MLIGEETAKSPKKRFKVALNVHHFNELQGVDEQVIDLANRRLDQVQNEAQIEIDKATTHVDDLQTMIGKYKSLKPECKYLSN